jgi:urease accessory protein
LIEGAMRDGSAIEILRLNGRHASSFEHEGRESGSREWVVWQVVDSAFPTGGFAHSAGLEAAWQQGEIGGPSELKGFVVAGLRQLKRAAIPFVNTAHREPGRLADLDELFDVFTSNHVANRASRKQGRAFVLAANRVFPVVENGPLTIYAGKPENPVHFAPVFGALLRALELSMETAVRLFVFNQMRSVLAAAVRLNVVGPMEAQAIQFELGREAEAVAAEGLRRGLDDIAQTAPLLDLWQGTQDRLYSRLFQS